jgi:valyl-tRNA synthetase
LRLDFSPPVNPELMRSPNEDVTVVELRDAERLDQAKQSLETLLQVFECALRMLSPFMPFITEQLWYAVYDENPPAKSIALTHYPQAGGQYVGLKWDQSFYTLQATSHGATQEMTVVQKVITVLRALRKDAGVPEKETVDARVYCTESEGSLTMGYVTREADKRIINALAKVRIEVKFQAPPSGGFVRSETGFDVEVIYERTIDIPAERERLKKDISKSQKIIESSDRQLNNPGFLANAPAHIVEGLKKQRDEAKRLLDKAQDDLDELPEG